MLWLGLHGIDFLLARLRNDRDGGVANSGMQAFGLLFKTLALLVVLFAALSKSQDVALTAGLTYGLAYTFELGLSLASYFGKPRVTRLRVLLVVAALALIAPAAASARGTSTRRRSSSSTSGSRSTSARSTCRSRRRSRISCSAPP